MRIASILARTLAGTALLLMPISAAVEATAQSSTLPYQCYRTSNIVVAQITDYSATSVTAEACPVSGGGCQSASGTTSAQATAGYSFSPGTCYFSYVVNGVPQTGSETSN